MALDRSLLGESTPHLSRLCDEATVRRLQPVLPAVTCPVQASMLTGLRVHAHGVVGNGWYDRDAAEVRFWRQSNRLVAGEKAWETARGRDPSVTCANLFWWFNMHSSAEVAVTPRPMYTADGRKIPDLWTHPSDLRHSLQERLGRFPLFHFWGPGADIRSSRWIADAAGIVLDEHDPTLLLVYLPHLDYALQRLHRDDPALQRELARIDAVAGALIDRLRERGRRVVVVNEYGIETVEDAVSINRALREAGLVAIREELGREHMDPGASDAFAVADHQVAHIHLRDSADADRVAECCHAMDGVDQVLMGAARVEAGLDHDRAGDIVLVARHGRWFCHDWWLGDGAAPDYQRTVDIHRKPGYDPRELFLDPAIRLPRASMAWRLLRRAAGQRVLMDVIPLDTTLVRGSHGRTDLPGDRQPLLITDLPMDNLSDSVPSTAVRDVILAHLFA